MKLITRDELRAKLERGDEFKLVMTLPDRSFGAKHIPTSVNFESAEEAVGALDPGEEIIVYCADVYCAASIFAYRLLEREGYTRVRRYAGGVADWEAAGYPLDTFRPETAAHRRARQAARPGGSVSASSADAADNGRAPWRLCA
jgi:rhodanese-related sulfurtransferase